MLLDGGRANDEVAVDGQERTGYIEVVRVLEPNSSTRDGADGESVQVNIVKVGEGGERGGGELLDIHLSIYFILEQMSPITRAGLPLWIRKKVSIDLALVSTSLRISPSIYNSLTADGETVGLSTQHGALSSVLGVNFPHSHSSKFNLRTKPGDD